MSTSRTKVNKALEGASIPLFLERGKGYQYFIFDDGTHYETVSVYVCFISHLTLEQWVVEARGAWAEIQARIGEHA